MALARLRDGDAASASAIACLRPFDPAREDDAGLCTMAGPILVGAASRAALRWFDRALALTPRDAALLGHRAAARAAVGAADPARLAGDPGRPVFVLSQESPEWRWMLGTSRGPWSATARLPWQACQGDWTAPVAALDNRPAADTRTPLEDRP